MRLHAPSWSQQAPLLFILGTNSQLKNNHRRPSPIVLHARSTIIDHVLGDGRQLGLYFPFLSNMQWPCLRSEVWFQDLIFYFFLIQLMYLRQSKETSPFRWVHKAHFLINLLENLIRLIQMLYLTPIDVAGSWILTITQMSIQTAQTLPRGLESNAITIIASSLIFSLLGRKGDSGVSVL